MRTVERIIVLVVLVWFTVTIVNVHMQSAKADSACTSGNS